MQKNDILEGKVVDIGSNGEGIVKQDGTVVFVPFSIEGEKIEYKVLKVKGNIAFGKLLRVLEKSPFRREPVCPCFTKCGGCNLQHVSYEKQLDIKRKTIEDAFLKIAKINVKTEEVVTGNGEYRYRNKLQLPVVNVEGKSEIGFYSEYSHRVVPIDDCMINAEWTKDIISAFKEYFLLGIKGYDEASGSGDIREVAVKEIGGNLIITVVTPNSKLKHEEKLVSILKNRIKNVFSLYHNVNENKNNVIFGERYRLIYGEPNYNAEMLGIKYKIGVTSFMQVNTTVCEKLYKTVSELAGENKDKTVIDAYSGAGLMTAILSLKAKRAIGIEIVPEAVKLANELSGGNGLSQKITNYLGKCEEIMPDIMKDISDAVIVLDPPRKGCDRKVIESVSFSGAEKIIYVSCMPSTLARDVGLLTGTLKYDGNSIVDGNEDGNYKVEKVIPFDMFPNTKHVETVVLLKKVI